MFLDHCTPPAASACFCVHFCVSILQFRTLGRQPFWSAKGAGFSPFHFSCWINMVTQNVCERVQASGEKPGVGAYDLVIEVGQLDVHSFGNDGILRWHQIQWFPNNVKFGSSFLVSPVLHSTAWQTRHSGFLWVDLWPKGHSFFTRTWKSQSLSELGC